MRSTKAVARMNQRPKRPTDAGAARSAGTRRTHRRNERYRAWTSHWCLGRAGFVRVRALVPPASVAAAISAGDAVEGGGPAVPAARALAVRLSGPAHAAAEGDVPSLGGLDELRARHPVDDAQ